MTTGRGRGVDEEGRREGGRRGCRHEAAMISAKLKTRSRFEFDRSVEQIAMTGSVEKRRKSTVKVKAAMVWQDLNRGTHCRQKGLAPGRLAVN